MEIKEIEEFVKTKRGSSTYKSWLKKYFVVHGYLKIETKKDKQGRKVKTYVTVKDPSKYFKEKRDYDSDVLKFVDSIKSWAPATKKSCVSCIKNFYKFNNIRLLPKTEYLLKERCKGPKAVSQEKVPTKNELKEILSYGGVRHRAVFLSMASSGMRPGEIIQINLSDIHLDETPARIEVAYDITKTQQSRTTFISSEAKAYVKQWLKIREPYIKSAVKRSTLYPKVEDDSRVFPFTDTSLRQMWLGILNKAGYASLDERNGKNRQRHKMTPHKLRKFFKTQMSDGGIPIEISEDLMGHSSGVNATYRRPTPNQLKNWYLKGEENLLIFEQPANQDDIDSLKNQMGVMQSQLEQLIGQTKWSEDRYEMSEEYTTPEGEKVVFRDEIKTSDKEKLESWKQEQRKLKEIQELEEQGLDGLKVWSKRQRIRNSKTL
jgi:integrase